MKMNRTVASVLLVCLLASVEGSLVPDPGPAEALRSTRYAVTVRTENGEPLIENILDVAGQKGTGKWTVMASMDLAEPTALVAEAVYARIVSSDPDRRRRAADIFDSPVGMLEGVSVADIEASLYASKIISYAQGFRLMQAASAAYGWQLDLGSVASLWRAGCIIRAEFLEDITTAYRTRPDLPDLIEEPFFAGAAFFEL